MPIYHIGNSLRAIRNNFEAASDKEAWEIGRAKVNEAMPTESGKGRFMELSRKEKLTAYDPELMNSGYSNLDSILVAWRTVYIGITGNAWPNNFPDNIISVSETVYHSPEALANTDEENHA